MADELAIIFTTKLKLVTSKLLNKFGVQWCNLSNYFTKGKERKRLITSHSVICRCRSAGQDLTRKAAAEVWPLFGQIRRFSDLRFDNGEILRLSAAIDRYLIHA